MSELGAPPGYDWQLLQSASIAGNLKYGQETVEGVSGAYEPLLDCGKENRTDILCTDRLAFQEASTFHDQHFGRFKVDFQMMKTCNDGDSQNTVSATVDQWENANGLFDVYLQYFDNFQNWGDQNPGNAFDENHGAGFRISDSWETDGVLAPRMQAAFSQCLMDQ